MRRELKRNALNRGTAVHLGENRVRFIWACGCKRVEHMKNPDHRAMPESTVTLLVRNWRANGVVLEQCAKHPDYYERLSQLERLNKDNPS